MGVSKREGKEERKEVFSQGDLKSRPKSGQRNLQNKSRERRCHWLLRDGAVDTGPFPGEPITLPARVFRLHSPLFIFFIVCTLYYHYHNQVSPAHTVE
jgi:hypothetical protein